MTEPSATPDISKENTNVDKKDTTDSNNNNNNNIDNDINENLSNTPDDGSSKPKASPEEMNTKLKSMINQLQSIQQRIRGRLVHLHFRSYNSTDSKPVDTSQTEPKTDSNLDTPEEQEHNQKS